MRSRRVVVLSFLLATLAASACVPYRPFTLPPAELAKLPAKEQAKYRPSISPCGEGLGAEAGQLAPDQCELAIIEFDDQGEFWRPQQLDDTLKLISSSTFHDADHPQDPDRNQEALVVVFVHGWKNNASPDNEKKRNLGSFKKVLVRLALEEKRRATEEKAKGRPVVGVYLSWSGRTLNVPVLDNITYFGRKNAAERVARVSFSHAIYRIISTVKGNRAKHRGNPKSVVAVVGHSFGGLIVENTLLRSLTIETNDFSEFAADLVVLVNPANEAILARQFVGALKNAPPRVLELEGHRISEPLIVSVRSQTDNATGIVFQMGNSLKGISKRMHRYHDEGPGLSSQWYYYTHTPGYTSEEAELYSHHLVCPFSPQAPICERAPETSAEYESKMRGQLEAMRRGKQKTIFPPPAIELGPCKREREAASQLECIERLSFIGATTGQVYTIDHDQESANQTGYWILQLPPTIVASHSDIFNSELASLLSAFINLKDANVVASPAESKAYLEGEAVTQQQQ